MGFLLNPSVSDQDIREVGFTDYAKEKWYLCKRVFDHTTLNVTIIKNTGEVKIDVLDEFFLQPILFDLLVPDIKEEMINNVNQIISNLQSSKILVTK
jgi:hypothetical protein